MDKYLGVKLIEAEPMTEGQFHIFKDGMMPSPDSDGVPGYKVVYPDGYVSWSPKGVFEEAYRRIDDLTYGLAIEALRKGHKVARKGWNGKGMFVLFEHGKTYGDTTLSDCFLIKNTKGNYDTWVASISDTLAEDWTIVE